MFVRWAAAALLSGSAMLAAAPCAASEAATDPIDAALATCLAAEGGDTTAGTVQCLGKASESWDKEMNRAYQALAGSLDSRSRGLLKRSQRQWIAYRDAEMRFMSSPFASTGGSMQTVTLNEQAMQLVRNRALALRAYEAPAE